MGALVRFGREPTGAREYLVTPGCDAEGTTIADVPLHDDEWVTLVVRDGGAIQPGAGLRLRARDRVLILTEPHRSADLAEAFTSASSDGRRDA